MLLRPTEAAAEAGLSRRAIYRAIQRGELRAVRRCSRLRILFVVEGDTRNAEAKALAVPPVPPRHEARENPASVRRVGLPGIDG